MLTINVISKEDGKKIITGVVNGEKFNIPFSEEAKANLEALNTIAGDLETVEDYNTWLAEVKEVIAVSENVLGIIETNCPDLLEDKKTGKFYLKTKSGVASHVAVPEKIVDMILKAVDLELSPMPIIKAWVRFMRNPKFTLEKAEKFAEYITKTIIDWDEVERLTEEEGYTEIAAKMASTYQDVTISQEGQIVCKKYAELITKGWRINKETNEAEQYDKYLGERSIDDVTGEITEGDPDYGYTEELNFRPPVQGTRGDAFFCGENKGHIIKVGQVHKLESWNQVNCNDNTSCVPGLHVGGWQYVDSYKGLNCQLLDCLVDPAEIGAICGLSEHSDGAIRCKEYFIYGATIGRMKGLYHSSKYAAIKDQEWEKFKTEAIEATNKKIAKLADQQ